MSDEAILRELSWPGLSDVTTAQLEGRREVLRAEVNFRCTRRTVDTMARLSDGATRLQWVGLGVAGAALLLAIVEGLARWL